MLGEKLEKKLETLYRHISINRKDEFMKLKDLEPKSVFTHFEKLTQIPRCSGNEREVSDYLKAFGEDLGLEVIQDEALNIIIKKAASKGYEDHDAVIIQGHMDIVCEKTPNCNIDFEKDPLNIEIEDGYIIAKETTLGADNGIAVAMAMAILEDESLKHPPLEILITTDEERGMTGAANIDPKNLKARKLLNIDSEAEGVVTVSCAGGARDHLFLNVSRKEQSKNALKIKVDGLMGGHSGLEIDKGRGNANQIMGRLLYQIFEKFDIKIINLDGGSKDNAIPRLSEAILEYDGQYEEIKKCVRAFENSMKLELGKKDPNLFIEIEKTKSNLAPITKEDTEKIISLLMLLHTGVLTMSANIEDLVESSVNMGVMHLSEDEFELIFAPRSSVNSLKEFFKERFEIIAKLVGAKYERRNEYPAWEFQEESELRDKILESYRELTGKEMKIEALHAGLECGLFGEILGDMDMISIGPDMQGVHAPGEKLDIESAKRTYELVINLLERL